MALGAGPGFAGPGFVGAAVFLAGTALGVAAFLAGVAAFLAAAFFTGLAAGAGSACFFVAIMGGGWISIERALRVRECDPRLGFPGLPADFIRV